MNSLQAAKRRRRVDAPTKGADVAARERKKLTKAEQRTPKGRFAMHLAALMQQRAIDNKTLADRLGIGEATVRKWLRAESVPETLDLEALGKALGLLDYRSVLPPSK